jgi:hypothetical protein
VAASFDAGWFGLADRVIFPKVTQVIPTKYLQALAALLARGLTNKAFADRVWSVC